MNTQEPCVLLISPGIIKWTDLDFGLPHLVSLGGYLQEHLDVRVEILDLCYEGGDQNHLKHTLEQLDPFLLIGLSCYSSFDYMRVMALARFLKEIYADVPLIVGGYHASALPNDFVFDGSPFDAVVVGEGELALQSIVETLLGSVKLEQKIYDKGVVEDLDSLPPYKWELLNRYWSRAYEIGRKFQIYLSRGCPYHCTFCMERAKGGYKWRAFSPQRALDELQRLTRFTKLKHWVVNIADPLFGFQRNWRRQVLEGIVSLGLEPKQYWTLTRADDLSEEDVILLARANFSVGIGLESGSPHMLELMQKSRNPKQYLEALENLGQLSRKHSLNWAANIIVGHPGETRKTMQQTLEFVSALFAAAKETCGWLSIDPFRLYPGSYVHENMKQYTERYGTFFYHSNWWSSWYDTAFRAEHIDPSSDLDFETRVRFMYENYAPLLQKIGEKFRGQGKEVDRVFERSINEQKHNLSNTARDSLLQRAAFIKNTRCDNLSSQKKTILSFPIGLQIKNPWIRQREEAVKRLLEKGILHNEALIEAFLLVPPEEFLSEQEAKAMLVDSKKVINKEGDIASYLGISIYALALESLGIGSGDKVADLTAQRGYVGALMAHLVGPSGKVVLVNSWSRREIKSLRKKMAALKQVEVVQGKPTIGKGLEGQFDGIWLGAALPCFPKDLLEYLRDPGGCCVTAIGPRFRAQDLVCLRRQGDKLNERLIAHVKMPVVKGPEGWII